jgi:hypothetical protein
MLSPIESAAVAERSFGLPLGREPGRFAHVTVGLLVLKLAGLRRGPSCLPEGACALPD